MSCRPTWIATRLVIGSSYSGNTEETLAVFEEAHERGCPLVALATGGRLAELAQAWGVPLVSFRYKSQPRAAMGYYAGVAARHPAGAGRRRRPDGGAGRGDRPHGRTRCTS